jgi:GTP-binding protein Era
MKNRPMARIHQPSPPETAHPPTASKRGARAETQAGTVAGTVAIVGPPNVGKSTLLNQLLGAKLAIVSPRPQTTRNCILGVWTGNLEDGRARTQARSGPESQIVFLDTPGLHEPRSALGRFMVQEALAALAEADAILLVVDVQPARPQDTSESRILAQCLASRRPLVLALNKVDRLRDKRRLLPLLQAWAERGAFAALVPISATKGLGLADLRRELLGVLPSGSLRHDPDTLTDRSERFLAAELIREQLFLRLRQELPSAVAVVIDHWEARRTGDVVIDASILVEREPQKAIVVGRGGTMIRDVGTAARTEITKLLGRSAHVRLHVKVASHWTDTAEGIARLGYRPGE